MLTITTGTAIWRISFLDSYPVMRLPSEPRNRLNIARATISHWLHPVTKGSLDCIWVSKDHVWIHAVALKMTCKKVKICCQLKIIPFLQLHIAHRSAHIPIQIRAAIVCSTPVNHVPDNDSISTGGLMLKAIWIILQSNFASGHSMNKCCIVSSRSQKQQRELPTHRLFNKLSLMRITCLCTNHIKM